MKLIPMNVIKLVSTCSSNTLIYILQYILIHGSTMWLLCNWLKDGQMLANDGPSANVCQVFFFLRFIFGEIGEGLGKVLELGFKLRTLVAQRHCMSVHCPQGHRHRLSG